MPIKPDQTLSLETVVQFLNSAQVRATYGAVGQAIDVHPKAVGGRLTQLYGRSPPASWVVNATTGMPTGYTSSERHAALLSSEEVIRSGDDLRRRVLESLSGGSEGSGTAAKSQAPQPISVDDLADLRRQLTTLLNSIERGNASPSEGIRKRIRRLSQPGGVIPREIAAMMTTITEMRNSAEYESKILSAAECAVVHHAWCAIQDWAKSKLRP